MNNATGQLWRMLAIGLCMMAIAGYARADAPLNCPGAGTVLTHSKISMTSGGFQGPLNQHFARALATLGDLDGDSVPDIAVGETANADGRVWILLLNADGSVKEEKRIYDGENGFVGPVANFASFGEGLGAIGDLDGDGVIDLAVGAPRDAGGQVWILFMNSDGTVKTEQKIAANTGGFTGQLDNDDFFGRSVTGIGDLDGDGVLDLAVGAARDDDGGNDRGAVWILFLNPDGTVKSQQKISSNAGGFLGQLDNEDRFGTAVAGLGDLDDDGVPDIAIGAPEDDDGGLNNGAVWIAFLLSDGTIKAEQKISSANGGFGGSLAGSAVFGGSVAAIGDIDGDSVGDLAIGAKGDDDGGNERGATWIAFLNATGRVKAEQKISDSAGGFADPLDDRDFFGYAVAAIGDLDGDGFLDLAVGADRDDDGGADLGAVWILNLDGCAAPPNDIVITVQPDSVLLPAGGALTSFTVLAQGAEPLNYQWRRDGVELTDDTQISGANSATVTIFAANDDIGLYDCLVWNTRGQVVTDAAVLGVRPTCLGDLDADGTVGASDLNLLLSAWGTVCGGVW